MFSIFITRAISKSHVPTPASPDMFDADNTVGKIRPKTPTEVMGRPTEVQEPAITTDIELPPGSATDNSGVVGPSTDTEAVSTRFLKGPSKKGKGPSKKGKGPASNGKQSDVYGPTSHEAGGSGLRYTLFILY